MSPLNDCQVTLNKSRVQTTPNVSTAIQITSGFIENFAKESVQKFLLSGIPMTLSEGQGYSNWYQSVQFSAKYHGTLYEMVTQTSQHGIKIWNNSTSESSGYMSECMPLFFFFVGGGGGGNKVEELLPMIKKTLMYQCISAFNHTCFNFILIS